MQPIKLYTIYTEDTGRQAVFAILDQYFDSYTIVPSIGHWKGSEEKSLVLQIVTFDRASVYLAANDIKLRNKQESVLVTEQAITHNAI